MDKFKQKIQKRILWMALVLIFMCSAFTMLKIYGASLPPMVDFIKGFQFGAYLSLELFLVFFIVRDMASLNNEQALKRLYIQENDERKAMILQKTGATGMTICMIGLAAAAVISGFFNEIVFFTLLGATVFTALIKGFFKLYYHSKF